MSSGSLVIAGQCLSASAHIRTIHFLRLVCGMVTPITSSKRRRPAMFVSSASKVWVWRLRFAKVSEGVMPGPGA